MLDSIDKKIINILQEDIKLSEEPFNIIAKELSISEDEAIERIKNLKELGVLKRIGAILYHREAGFKANAMVVWCVDENLVDEVGKKLSSIPEITHCYERRVCEEWKYNLFTMIHGESHYDCEELIRGISNKIGIKDYKILYSTEELKKTSMKYNNL